MKRWLLLLLYCRIYKWWLNNVISISRLCLLTSILCIISVITLITPLLSGTWGVLICCIMSMACFTITLILDHIYKEEGKMKLKPKWELKLNELNTLIPLVEQYHCSSLKAVKYCKTVIKGE